MRSWRVWLGFLVSLIFLVLALRGQDFNQIWAALRAANYVWLVPALGAYFLGVAVRAVRWDYLLRSIVRVSSIQLFPIVVIGYMANNVLPLRAGELVRSYALSSRYKVRKTAAIATIAIERLFDGLTMLLFIILASLSVALTSDLRNVVYLASALFVILTVGLLILVFAPTFRDRAMTWFVNRLPPGIGRRVQRMAGSFIDGLGILRRKGELFSVLLTSILAWLCEASMYLLIAEGFNLDLSLPEVLLVTAVANLATIIPSSPGYIGPFEAGVLLVLSGALGYSREVALSYAIVVHAALYFPVTALGFVFWWRESLSWGAMRNAEKAAG
jgi:hypothetical protein